MSRKDARDTKIRGIDSFNDFFWSGIFQRITATTPTMALQPCRASLSRSRQATRTLMPCLRAYSTTTTDTTTMPESFKAAAENSNGGLDKDGVPRWKRTPPAMKAAMQMDFAKNPRNKVWQVNNDPERLDRMYDTLLGPGGATMLPEELKWLAVTHKSFDQGRRGFNDRLALLGMFSSLLSSCEAPKEEQIRGLKRANEFMTGRMAINLETAKDIVSRPTNPGAKQVDEYDRQPFEHEQLAGVDNLSVYDPREVAGKERLYSLAQNVGLMSVMRWKPRLVCSTFTHWWQDVWHADSKYFSLIDSRQVALRS